MGLLEAQKNKEKEKEIREENRLKNHKCNGCQWGHGQKLVINACFQGV